MDPLSLTCQPYQYLLSNPAGVVGAEVAAFLQAVDAVAHGVEVQDDFPGVLVQATHAQRQQRGLDLWRIGVDFGVAVGGPVALFEALQGGGGGQGRGAVVAAVGAQGLALVAGDGQERIAAQGGVIVEVVVAQGLGQEALEQQLAHGVVAVAGVAGVGEGAGQGGAQPQAGIELTQEQDAAVAGEVAAGEIGHDLAAAQVLKEERLVFTVCPVSGGGGASAYGSMFSSLPPPPPPFCSSGR